MTLNFLGRLALAGCLLLVAVGCEDGSGVTGGTGGSGGAGSGGPPAHIPGLWEGSANGFVVCFYVSDDGLRLEPSGMCNVTGVGQPAAVPRSFDIRVDPVGVDEQGEPCDFDLSFTNAVAIDPETGAFSASEEVGDGVEQAFSGEIIGNSASGVALQDSGGSVCRLGWSAAKSTECTEEAIQSCLDLLNCCRSILVSPVFFDSCNSVALQCDQARCLEVLAGYPRCAPEPELDAGTPDGG
jgi:hypothetical protein